MLIDVSRKEFSSVQRSLQESIEKTADNRKEEGNAPQKRPIWPLRLKQQHCHLPIGTKKIFVGQM